MLKKVKIETSYPFEWLDNLVDFQLNPERTDLDTISANEIGMLNDIFQREFIRISDLLKSSAFCLLSLKKIKSIVSLYETSVNLLLAQAEINQESYADGSLLQATGRNLIDNLKDFKSSLNKRYAAYVTGNEPTHQPVAKAEPPEVQKLLCRLSVDQLGIILKAADDVKLIVSRSLSIIFRSVVPYLSTERKKDLSWDSMRSSTYHPEAADKEAAIEALEKLIQKIKEY